MNYFPLNAKTIPGYLKQLDNLSSVLIFDSLTIEEVGDGNVNYVYRITSKPNNTSVILKQAVPYLRVAGTEWPLDRNRIEFEARALRLYGSIVPDLVPKLYHVDTSMSVIVMQCLSNHIVLRRGMIAGIEYPRISDHLSTFLAETLFRTSSFCMSSHDKRSLMHNFNMNMDLCKLSEDLIFSFPLMKSDSNYTNPHLKEHIDRLYRDAMFRTNFAWFKYKFMNCTDALLHGDLHTGSIMVNEQETYVIDPEFAFFGPFGFDVGKLLGNFLLASISHYYRSVESKYRSWLMAAGLETVRSFFTKFDTLWAMHLEQETAMFHRGYLRSAERFIFQERFRRSLIQDITGFAGCTIARRILGIAGVADIREVADLTERARLEGIALELARILLNNYASVCTLEDLESLVASFFDGVTSVFRMRTEVSSLY
ncbi:S-methyl-5-thioribose kinase [Nostoc sp. 'Peltigera membranacea cyanobiont' 210A]|uniref:S-methyl-5-thioribose kinase n=1 Tax=Nostoc sp. 'Peltigera membranacea cyanobiont' 210A TaxID=2014529 RepID=UPI000B95B7B1|nr:S-methyl-5-thioribose kinase [Nostoc sp. 'Peltigera membranacea cyanobiont' 210A]OYD89702.1 S-methyl-5-thioribose kinase [Nostoc sp. 'Peltigera membranacea cyanobiont' 210A]